jgi:hypothetical protein
MKLKSTMGLFPIDTGWILVYPDPNDSEHIIQEAYTRDDDDIVNILYTIKESCLQHYNSKHNEYNIAIDKRKVKK